MGNRYIDFRKIIYLIGFLSFAVSSLSCLAQKNTFIRTYNLPGMNGGLDLTILSDGGFVGTGQHADVSNCRVYAYRIDECGNLIWFNLYANGGGISISDTDDGGVIIGGEMDGHGGSLLKIDDLGDIQWSKYYSGIGSYICSAIETSDGDFFVGGEGAILKSNANGTVLWSASVASGKIHAVDEFSNGDYLFLSINLPSSVFNLGRVTPEGVLVWENSYGTQGGTIESHYDWAGDALIDDNDNVIVTSNSSTNNGNIVISKIDGDGNQINTKDIGSVSQTDLVRSISVGLNGGFILGGATYGYNTSVNDITQNPSHTAEDLSGRDILLVKLDDDLNLEWSSVIGSGGSDKGIGVRANNDNGYTISAYTDGGFFNADSFDPLFIKTDSTGVVGCQQYSPSIDEESITLTQTATTSFSSSSLVGTDFSPAKTAISPVDYFMCLDCSTVPSFYISDTTLCVGDTTYFINESSGLLCYQDWYVDNVIIEANSDSILFIFETSGLHTIELITNCGNGSESFILDVYVNDIGFEITSQSDYNGYGVSCFDSNDGFIETTVISQYPPISYQWNAGNITPNIYNLNANTYHLFINDDFGCSLDTIIEITQPSELISDIQTINNYNGFDVSCHSYNDGNIVSTTTGGVAPYIINWSSQNNFISTNEDLSQLYAGTYFLNVVDDNGCILNSSITLSQPPILSTILTSNEDYNGYDISCFGAFDGGVSSIISGGIAPYSLLWNNGQTSSTISNLSLGQYELTVTDLNGCIISDSITLIEPTQLLSSIQSNNNYNGFDISCINAIDGAIGLSVSGSVPPYSFNWNTGATSQNLANVPAGQYNVSIVDDNGCADAREITLSEPSAFSSNYTTSDYNGYHISCYDANDGWIDFTIGGSVSPYSFSWNGPNNFQSASEDINALFVGTYSINIVDDNGCVFNSNITLSEPPTLSTILTSNEDYNGYDISCFGAFDGGVSSIISGGIAPTPYFGITVKRPLQLVICPLASMNLR